MAITTKLAKRVLGKKEQKHLTEMGINSMRQFLEARELQIRQTEMGLSDGLTPGIAEACWECRQIARKLGID